MIPMIPGQKQRPPFSPAQPTPPPFPPEPEPHDDPAPPVTQPRFGHGESAVLALCAMAGLGFVLNVVNATTSGAITVPPNLNPLITAAAIPMTLLVEQLIRLIRASNPDLPTVQLLEATHCDGCTKSGQEFCGHGS